MPGTIGNSFLFETPFEAADWFGQQSLFSPDEFSISRRKSYCTIKAYVEDYDKLKNCVRYLLGTQHTNQSNQLIRDMPARHPVWPEMFAREILSLKGVEPDGNLEPVQPAKLKSGNYEKFLIEVAFSQRDYPVLANDRVTSEAERFVVTKSKPYVENIVMEGGQLVFEATGKDWDAQPILSSRPIVRQEKATYSIDWYEVPLDFVANSSGEYVRFEDAIGKLNDTTFMGKPAGTMLLDDYDTPDVYTDPIATDLFGGDPKRACDIRMTFKHFDPPRGLATETRRGWNLAPAYDGLYYWAKNPDTSQPQFRDYEMNDLFTHW